jgi:hypothetical protein
MEKKLLLAAQMAGIEVAKDDKDIPSNASTLELLKEIDLDSDFDPEKFDQQMSSKR